MTLFQMKWLRRLVRRHSSPIPEVQAAMWKRRLSFAYAFVAWNAFGFVTYLIFTGRADWASYYGFKSDAEKNESPGAYYSRIFNVEKGKIVRFSGLSKIDEEEFNNVTEKTN